MNVFLWFFFLPVLASRCFCSRIARRLPSILAFSASRHPPPENLGRIRHFVVSDQVGAPAFQRLLHQFVILWIAVLDERFLYCLFMRIRGTTFSWCVIVSGIGTHGGDGGRRRIEICTCSGIYPRSRKYSARFDGLGQARAQDGDRWDECISGHARTAFAFISLYSLTNCRYTYSAVCSCGLAPCLTPGPP